MIFVLKKTNIRKYISEHDVIKKLNKDIGAFKRGAERLALWVNNRSNYNKLLQKVLDFNTNSPYKDDYVARVIKIQDSETGGVYIGINVERRNRMNSIEAEQIEYNENLNSKLRRILEKFGIKVGVLNDLEERRGINGVTDFSRAKDAAEGLIELIRLAKGERGEKALPEEFSHFIIEAMGDNPLITRLINLIASKGLAQEIMGDAYDAYTLEYGGNELKLAKEAAG